MTKLSEIAEGTMLDLISWFERLASSKQIDEILIIIE